MEYLSSDSLDKSETIESCHFHSLTTEFLNSLTKSGLLNHCIKLKIGTPIMLLRNLDQTQGLCNDTYQTAKAIWNSKNGRKGICWR